MNYSYTLKIEVLAATSVKCDEVVDI